jgi:hypothetical protein
MVFKAHFLHHLMNLSRDVLKIARTTMSMNDVCVNVEGGGKTPQVEAGSHWRN